MSDDPFLLLLRPSHPSTASLYPNRRPATHDLGSRRVSSILGSAGVFLLFFAGIFTSKEERAASEVLIWLDLVVIRP